MNRNLLFFMGAMAYCCALTAPTAMAQDQPQADPQITALPTANAYQISWPGVAGRLYYLQFTTSLDGWTSNDQEIWTCAPAVFLGDGSTVTAGFSSTVPRSFVRLKYSLATHYTEGDNGDADGDGLSNIDEVSIHLTEPLLADTDNDGLSDSDEITGGTNPLQFNVPAITIEHAWREAVIYHFNLNCPDPHTRLYRNLAATAPPGTLATRSLSPFDLSNSQHVNTLDPYVAVSNAWAAANGVPAFTPYVQNWGGWVPYDPQTHKLEGILRRDYTGGYLSDTELPPEFTRLSITDNTLPTGTTAYNRSVYYGTDRDVRLKTAWPVPYPITRSFIRIDREGTAPASNLNNVTWTDTGYSTVTLTIPAGQTYSNPNPAGIWTADTRLLSRPDKLSANPSSQPFFTTARAERRFVLLPVDLVTINTFIPHNNVEDPRPLIGTLFKGDNRNFGTPPRAVWDENGSHRTQQRFQVIADQTIDSNGLVDNAFGANADGNGNSDRYVHIGETKSFDPDTSVDASGNLTATALADTAPGAPLMIDKATAPQTEVWLENAHFITPKKFAVKCRCEASNPLVTGSPAISYTINITIDRSTGTYSMEGSHDGFPAYEIYINGKRVYQHDPLATGDDLNSLFPDEEYTINEVAKPLP